MNADSITALLDALDTTPSGERGAWINAPCPFAFARHTGGADNSPSFGVAVNDEGLSGYRCLACNVAGANAAGLVTEFRALAGHRRFPAGVDLAAAVRACAGDTSLGRPRRRPAFEHAHERTRVVLFDDAERDAFPPVASNPQAAAYLVRRHCGPRLARWLDVRYDPDRRRAVFPLLDPRGRLVGLHGRDVTGDNPLRWYAYKGGPERDAWNKTVWFGEWFVDTREPVVVVEAILDLTSVMRVTRNVVAPMLAGLSTAKVERMSAASHVVTLFDRGTGGDAAREAMARHHPAATLVQLVPATADDPGDMRAIDIARQLAPHVPIVRR